MYSDVNVELKDTELEGEGEDDKETTDAGHVDAEYENINQEVAGDQVKDVDMETVTVTPATQKTEVPLPSSSISSDYATKILNFDYIPSADTEIISMMDIKVQHEDPSSTTIPPPIPPFIPFSQQSTPIPTPTTTEAKISTITAPDFSTLTVIHQRHSDLENEVNTLKNVKHGSTIRATIKSEVPTIVKEYLGTSLDDTLHKVIQRHTLELIKEHSIPADVVEVLQQQQKPQKSAADIRKIKMEQAGKQQETKYTITSSNTTELQESDQKRTLFETMTKTKSFNKNTKHKALYHALMESILENEDAMDKGVADKSKKRKPDDADKDEGPPAGSNQGPPTPDPEWNKCKTVNNKPTQKWLSDLAKAEKPSKTFDDLMSTPIGFSAFAMNRLQISDLTQDILVGPAYKLLKGTCRCYIKLEYNMEECYKALNDQLDWKNPEGDRYPFDLSKPLPLVQSRNHQIVPINYFFNNNLAYLQGGSTGRTYTTSLTKTKVVKYDLQGIEDMKKLNISRPLTHNAGITDLKPYTTYSNPQGVIYLDKLERNRLMCSHELYKFSDGTLISIRDKLKDMLNNLEIGYTSVMPRSRWSNLDKKRYHIMVKDIDRQLLEKRLMRSLEKFVGGREYGEDLRLLQRTI
ncbi:hypothetical protein Tco_0405761 [Tanacetum coccineum]